MSNDFQIKNYYASERRVCYATPEIRSGFDSETCINEIVPAFPRAVCQELIPVQAEVMHEALNAEEVGHATCFCEIFLLI